MTASAYDTYFEEGADVSLYLGREWVHTLEHRAVNDALADAWAANAKTLSVGLARHEHD